MNRLLFPLLLAFILSGLGACNRTLDEPLRTVSNGVRDSSADIRTVLNSSPYHLFNQAFQRLKLDSAFGFYTLFAPTDSVMQAAGLTSAVIDALPTDSLYKLVAYHTVFNNYNDSVLTSSPATVRAPSLRRDVYYTRNKTPYSSTLNAQTFQQSLYLWKKDGVLYVNGEAAGTSQSSLKARNGWIWPVNHLFTAPANTVWQILLSKPELSMYVASYRMVDSFYQMHPVYYVTTDSGFFVTAAYENTLNSSVWLTVFAPTNAAFARAGLNTLDDIRAYVTRTLPGGYSQSTPPYNYVYRYSAMDSVLKQHYLYSATNAFMYQDLLNSSVMNNGVSNTNQWLVQVYNSSPLIPRYYNQFSNNNGVVNIQYSPKPSVPPAVLPPDGVKWPALNGIIYETDQLFYPHN